MLFLMLYLPLSPRTVYLIQTGDSAMSNTHREILVIVYSTTKLIGLNFSVCDCTVANGDDTYCCMC